MWLCIKKIKKLKKIKNLNNKPILKYERMQYFGYSF